MNIVKETLDPGNHKSLSLPVLTFSHDHQGPYRTEWHSHFRAQLVYASKGVMSVAARTGTWVVPPQQAVWVPAGVQHEVSAQGPLSMRSLYLHPRFSTQLPSECCVMGVSVLMRELVLRAVELSRSADHRGRLSRLMRVVMDEIIEMERPPLHLPMPRDPRLRTLVDLLLHEPADPRGLGDYAKLVGASTRTIARGFARETGMSFGTWRQRLRLLAAIERMGAGASVTTVAYELGYQSPSAFIAMFRRTLGEPPGRYFHASRELV